MERGWKAHTLVGLLVIVNCPHDENALPQDVIPDFARRRPARYGDLHLRNLCAELDCLYRESAISNLTCAEFRAEHFSAIAVVPRQAIRQLVDNTVEYLPLDELARRITTALQLVYPPGMTTVIPGDRRIDTDGQIRFFTAVIGE